MNIYPGQKLEIQINSPWRQRVINDDEPQRQSVTNGNKNQSQVSGYLCNFPSVGKYGSSWVAPKICQQEPLRLPWFPSHTPTHMQLISNRRYEGERPI